jgi:hypothetical protein
METAEQKLFRSEEPVAAKSIEDAANNACLLRRFADACGVKQVNCCARTT